MAFFDKRSPREIGTAHMELCGQLCRGVDPYSRSLNGPLDRAMAALPTKRILELDSNENAADDLIGCWLDEGMQRTTPHQRYIFMHSIFRVAVDAGARRHVAILAGELAAQELEGIMMASLKQGNTTFVMMTGQYQLEQFGNMLGDYYVLALSKILPFLASLKSGYSTDMEKATAEMYQQMVKERALQYIEAARNQSGDDSESIQALDRYKRMLNSE